VRAAAEERDFDRRGRARLLSPSFCDGSRGCAEDETRHDSALLQRLFGGAGHFIVPCRRMSGCAHTAANPIFLLVVGLPGVFTFDKLDLLYFRFLLSYNSRIGCSLGTVEMKWVPFVTIYLVDHMRDAETTPAQKIYFIGVLLRGKFPSHHRNFQKSYLNTGHKTQTSQR
jgi:hypothetical protein